MGDSDCVVGVGHGIISAVTAKYEVEGEVEVRCTMG